MLLARARLRGLPHRPSCCRRRQLLPLLATGDSRPPDRGRGRRLRLGASARPQAPAWTRSLGQRVGVAWLHRTRGRCRFCRSPSGKRDLCLSTPTSPDGPSTAATPSCAPRAPTSSTRCPTASAIAPPRHCFARGSSATGPYACALTGIGNCRRRCGQPARASAIYGFGAAGHVALAAGAWRRGAEVYVCTRDRTPAFTTSALATELGATWVGERRRLAAGCARRRDHPLAPAGWGSGPAAALEATDRGGSVVLGGIHMSPASSGCPTTCSMKNGSSAASRTTAREAGRAFLAEACGPAGAHARTPALPPRRRQSRPPRSQERRDPRRRGFVTVDGGS